MITKKKAKSTPQNYGRGAFSGYLDYRHGDRSSKRAVYAPGKNPVTKAVIQKDKRKQVLADTTAQLRSWETSPFEHEAATRAGLRAGLCLNGERWALADLIAADIVAEALRDIGAQRPTWEQGQREYTLPEDHCSWCASPLPDEVGQRSRFCSEHCARSALERRDFDRRQTDDATYRTVLASIRVTKAAPKACKECSKTFQSKEPDAMFCSERCAGEHGKRPKTPQTCKLCGKGFLSAQTHAGFCSATCRAKLHQLEKGIWQPKRLSTIAFDYFITLPTEAARPIWLTPDRFDQLTHA